MPLHNVALNVEVLLKLYAIFLHFFFFLRLFLLLFFLLFSYSYFLSQIGSVSCTDLGVDNMEKSNFVLCKQCHLPLSDKRHYKTTLTCLQQLCR